MMVRRIPYFIALATLLLVMLILRPGISAQRMVQKGMSYAAWWSGMYSDPDADFAMTHLAETGAEWISLIVTGYQHSISSTMVYTTTATPTDADLIHAIAQAHSRGLKVMLKPHVDLSVEGHWRGEIGQDFTETQWAAWFASYRQFVEHYAELAQSYGVEQFSVGCELVATAHRATQWRALIAAVRARYHGPITYAANHSGEETSITWWDAVDFIGVDAYYSLTEKDNPTLVELKAAWAPHVATLAALSTRWGKPILLTEIGYRSQDGANRHPWDWQSGGRVDLQEQADCYRAALESVYNRPWLAGIFWWAWGTDPLEGGPCNQDYTPHDKPAEDILRAWYGAPPRPTPTPTPQTDDSRIMSIYADALSTGWEDWSWDAQCALFSAAQAYSGTRAISITLQAWGALSLWHPALDTGPYTWLEFYVRRQWPGAVQLWAYFQDEHDNLFARRVVDDCRYVDGGTIVSGIWKRVRIPLVDLRAKQRLVSRITIADRSGQATTPLWLDEIRLVGALAPTATATQTPTRTATPTTTQTPTHTRTAMPTVTVASSCIYLPVIRKPSSP